MFYVTWPPSPKIEVCVPESEDSTDIHIVRAIAVLLGPGRNKWIAPPSQHKDRSPSLIPQTASHALFVAQYLLSDRHLLKRLTNRPSLSKPPPGYSVRPRPSEDRPKYPAPRKTPDSMSLSMKTTPLEEPFSFSMYLSDQRQQRQRTESMTRACA